MGRPRAEPAGSRLSEFSIQEKELAFKELGPEYQGSAGVRGPRRPSRRELKPSLSRAEAEPKPSRSDTEATRSRADAEPIMVLALTI